MPVLRTTATYSATESAITSLGPVSPSSSEGAADTAAGGAEAVSGGDAGATKGTAAPTGGTLNGGAASNGVATIGAASTADGTTGAPNAEGVAAATCTHEVAPPMKACAWSRISTRWH